VLLDESNPPEGWNKAEGTWIKDTSSSANLKDKKGTHVNVEKGGGEAGETFALRDHFTPALGETTDNLENEDDRGYEVY